MFPADLEAGHSPTFNVLQAVVSQLMDRGVFERDDIAETALSIWAHAHGLIALYLSGRIAVSRAAFRKLYMRSLDRFLGGLACAAKTLDRAPG